MRKYNGKPNIAGNIIEKAREDKKLSRDELASELQLLGFNVDRVYVYKVEKNQVLIKDFELVAFSIILDIDLNELKIFYNK